MAAPAEPVSNDGDAVQGWYLSLTTAVLSLLPMWGFAMIVQARPPEWKNALGRFQDVDARSGSWSQAPQSALRSAAHFFSVRLAPHSCPTLITHTRALLRSPTLLPHTLAPQSAPQSVHVFVSVRLACAYV